MHRCCFISTTDLKSPAELPGWVARLARSAEVEADTRSRVAGILESVRLEGLPAALRFTRELDGVELEADGLRVPQRALVAAREQLEHERPALMAALREMIGGIRRFAEGQRRCLGDLELKLRGGGSVGERWLPLERVGVYVPGGRAFYPSTLAMTVIPAQVAGVKRIVAVTPPKAVETVPGANGVDPLVLAAAAELGLEELCTLGGAQSVAWLAYGEPAVDLIAGPGNRFVAEAKRQLNGLVGIDSLAGPTELLVLADASADPARIAEDLLAQAEHDPDAAAVLISEDAVLLTTVQRELDRRVADSPRRSVLEQSLASHGHFFRADRELAIAFAQAWAPEHLELQVAGPEAWLPRLSAAGAIFVGSASAEAFGDYGIGPNHVLPTMRSARYASPLGVATFLKRQSVLRLSEADAAEASAWVAELAQAEGLPHHAASARLRAIHAHHS